MKAWMIAAGLSLPALPAVSEPAAPTATAAPPVATPASMTAAAPADKVTVAKPPKPPKPRLICEETRALGSMMTTEACATQAQWDARRRHDTTEFDRQNDVSGTISGGP